MNEPPIPDSPTHLLRLPFPIDQLAVWCGQRTRSIALDAVTSNLPDVTCPKCLAVMRATLDALLAWEAQEAPESPPTDGLPPNVTVALTRLRDGRWRATARATAWPAALVLSEALADALAEESAVRLHALETGAFV